MCDVRNVLARPYTHFGMSAAGWVRDPRESGDPRRPGDPRSGGAVYGPAPLPHPIIGFPAAAEGNPIIDRKSTRLNSSHGYISYAVFCLKKIKTCAPSVAHTPVLGGHIMPRRVDLVP